MDTPITKEEAAYQAIRGAIIQGELQPGQAVTIRDLAAKFGLGRTPITDAMKHLALDGWLESTTGVGTRGPWRPCPCGSAPKPPGRRISCPWNTV